MNSFISEHGRILKKHGARLKQAQTLVRTELAQIMNKNDKNLKVRNRGENNQL